MKEPIRFGKYLLLERINVGGMAEVFKAKTFGVEGFEKLVAIKRILPSIAEDREFISMFIDEAKITVKLQHANIAQVYELGKIEESYFIAMEFINGKDLKQLFDRNQRIEESMSTAQACFITTQVCSGLDYAHRKKDDRGVDQNIIHRDVSPQNIRISHDGEVKIIDFGIAKAKNKSTKTEAGILKGKFGYMAPEQVMGKSLNHQTDIYAIGIVFFEMITNRRLFQGETDFATLEKVRNGDVESPKKYNPDIPDELEAIMMKALAKDRKERYSYASDMHDDLQRFMILNNYMYSRADLANWMKDTYQEDIQRDLKKLKAFDSYSIKDVDSAYNSGGGSNHNRKNSAMDFDWDDDEFETQVFDKPEENKELAKTVSESEVSRPRKKPVKVSPIADSSGGKGKNIAIILVVAALCLIIAVFAVMKFLPGDNKPTEISIPDFIIHVNTKPQKDLVVFFDEKNVSNKTPFFLKKVKAGTHMLKINKPGYITFQKEINISRETLTPGELRDGLIEIPGEMESKKLKSYAINVEPGDQLKIYLNNKLVSEKAPYIFKNLGRGQHLLKIEKEGFKTYLNPITIDEKLLEKGDEAVNIKLEPGKTYEVKVIAPKGTTLTLNGKPVPGESPFALALVKGEHQLKLTSDLFETIEQTYKCEKNGTLNLKPKQIYAMVTFKSDPEGANVFLLDKRKEKSELSSVTPVTAKIEYRNVSRVIFEKEGVYPKNVRYRWNKKDKQIIETRLKMIPVKPVVTPQDQCRKRSGYIWKNNQCVKKEVPVVKVQPKPKTSPQDQCKKRSGYIWKNNQCVKRVVNVHPKPKPKVNLRTQCNRRSGYIWRNGRCVKKPKPKAKVKAKGYLSIMSRPKLNIKIDGRDIKRQTPIMKYALPVGTHRVILYGGKVRDSIKIKIEAGKTKAIIKRYK